MPKEQNTLTVALIGNPNSGKSTIFNALTKLRQKVGNYPGVTVEKKVGQLTLSNGQAIQMIDLPGIYSLTYRSLDEKVAHDVLFGRMKDTPSPDLVVCVVDASNLERNLYLVTQIQDLGIPVVIALNMVDMLDGKGLKIDYNRLSHLLGVPVICTIGHQGKGIEDLKAQLMKPMGACMTRSWRMSEPAEAEIQRLTDLLLSQKGFTKKSAFLEALILVSKEDKERESVRDFPEAQNLIREIRDNLTEWGINWRSAVIEARYAWIQKIVKDVLTQKGVAEKSLSDRIDAWVTHKVFGWLIFVGLMALMFYSIFSIATYPMDWIDHGFMGLSDLMKRVLPAGDLRDLLTDGIIAGVGGVVVFLPQILILFFYIGLLQDTGYMARAAFIMDRLMSRIGLHGKSFIPLLSSFACAIPGIMAARTIENRKDRLVTIMVAPLMSCSARLPVYTILIATIVPGATVFQKSAMMLFLYFLGMMGALVVALVFKKTLLKSQTPFFVMELPPYRLPSLKFILLQMVERAGIFLKKAGTIILGFSLILWILMSYPKNDFLNPQENLQKSFAGMIGTTLEPVIKPLGYDWRIGIGLIGSFAAREVFVSTMNIVFNINEQNEHAEPLRAAFQEARWPDERPLFTPLSCLSLMVFYVFALQCIGTIAVVRRETNGWKWPLFQVFYLTALAYVLSFMVYQGGRLLGFA